MTPPTGSAERRAGGSGRVVWARRRGRLADSLEVEPERFAPPPERFVAVAASADARFSLRLPGRDRGRFSSTPPSSVIGRESRVKASGYRPTGRARREVRRQPAGGKDRARGGN